jgi:ABC-type multidrug transport system ATPase subunit
MIQIRDLTKTYGDKTAVDHLTVTVRPGVVTGFLGPNGAGKSTTMRTIVGLDRPTGGQVLVNGRRYTNQPASRKPWWAPPTFTAVGYPSATVRLLEAAVSGRCGAVSRMDSVAKGPSATVEGEAGG